MMTRVLTKIHFLFLLTSLVSFSGCNQEDFYQKDYLNNPFQSEEPTDELTDDGGAQGGDVTGGADGSATGGTTGGVDGSVTAGTNGGNDGSFTGGTIGGVDGTTTAGTTGGVDGSTTAGTTGGVDGSTTGGTTGGTTTGGTTTGETTTGGTTTGGTTTGGIGDCNQGHGNDFDSIDESNPTIATESRCKKEVFRQVADADKKIDIIWIIDNSGSMADEQTSLGINFSAFINDFIDKDVDFKMSITTTDTSTADKKGRMVSGSDTKLTSARAKLNEVQFKEDFRTLVRVGTLGSSYEKGLAASEGFMQKYASTFIRKDAYLAVVIVTDEEDQSSKSVKSYTDYLKSYKSEAGLVKIYSIADIKRTNFGAGITTGATRYIEAARETAGVVADIRGDFYQSLSSMGDSLIRLLDSFALAQEPEIQSLKVFVNGVATSDFTYDESTRAIRFNQTSLPPVGSEIEVYYIQK
jgi:hypothetical protein